eukprot:g3416.t1
MATSPETAKGSKIDVSQKKFALISVSDKTGIVEFSQGLSDLGYAITSTGGSASVIEKANTEVTRVEDLTLFPEMLDGRVKTLHPSIHGGILAKRNDPSHVETLKTHRIPLIDIVVVNLYPFRETVLSEPRPEFSEGIEKIDIGGPAMIRAAAKNHEHVFVIVDPRDYESFLSRIQNPSSEQELVQFRRQLAWKAFQHCAQYDSHVSEWMWQQLGDSNPCPALVVPMELAHGLRYGENPHQKAAFYRDLSLEKHSIGGVASAQQHHGKEMSYNNYLDADAAYSCVSEFPEPSCVIVKHTNPCGVASRDDLTEAYKLAIDGDPLSAFGGIVAFNRSVDEKLAHCIKDYCSPTDGVTKMFFEIVIAPSYTPKGLEVLKQKSKNLRILEAELQTRSVTGIRQVTGGFLSQEEDALVSGEITFTRVSDATPSESTLADLQFAWSCVKHVKSNAIAIAKNRKLLGMGSGQPNRVKSVELALEKAADEIKGAALASDAFFPFSWNDAVEKACQAGVTAIAHPGGSIRDSDAVDCCNKYSVVLMTTSIRHFRSFRESARASLLERLFGSLKNADGSFPWRVLILDKVTTKVLSCALRMSELQSKGISLVENLDLAREPLQLEAIYFISPTTESIERLGKDQEDGLYKSCHVFFSSSVTSDALQKIKSNKALLQKLKTMKEADLEVTVLDSRCFLTEQPESLMNFYQENSDPQSLSYLSAMEMTVARLYTAFITLNEKPNIRYFLPQKFPSSMAHRVMICEKVAKMLDNKLAKVEIPGWPATPTCDCLILDRSIDAVAPVIHEWTYEAMVYDLLPIENNIYKRTTGSSESSTGEMVLDEEDPLWKELRHMHIAEASAAVNDKIDVFKKRNAAARIKGSGTNSTMTTSDMKQLIESLPEYRDVLSNMTLHVDITGDLFKITNDRKLKEIGELEQDLVYGDKHSKDIISLLTTEQNLTAEDKMRLFMCYLATHPDKLDSERRLQWQKLAQLNTSEMETMLNLEYLGISVTKKDGTSLLSFVRKNKSKGIRKGKVGDQYAQQYALEKFQPELSDIIEKLCTEELSVEEFPYTRPPPSGASSGSSAPAGSVRTSYAWGKKKKDTTEVKPQTRRLIVFLVGGISRSEIRVVHKLSSTLQRDMILGGTSVETPQSFIQKLSGLNQSIDDDAVRINID